MAGIFISYRRADSDGWAGRLRDALRARFGDLVFQDVDNIADGEIFSEVIDRALRECNVALVVIGPNWATARDEAGRRLDQEEDWVRTETAMVLDRKIRVIPVLVGGARLPRAEELPPELRSLTKRQAREIRSNSWDSDVALLANQLEQIVGQRKRPVWLYAVPALVLVAIGTYAGIRYLGEPPPPPARPEHAAAPPDTVPPPRDEPGRPLPDAAAPPPGSASDASMPKQAEIAEPVKSEPAPAPPKGVPSTQAAAVPPKDKPLPPSKSPGARPSPPASDQPRIAKPAATVEVAPGRKEVATPAPEPRRRAAAAPADTGAPSEAATATAPAAPKAAAETAAPSGTLSLPNRPASSRALKAGDSWTYRLRDVHFNKDLATVTHEISGGDAGGIRETLASPGSSRGASERRLALEPRIFEQPLAGGAALFEFAPFMTAFSELKPGVTWARIAGAASSESVNQWRFSGKVSGRERVGVPAGSFDAIKVELEGNLDISAPTTIDVARETIAAYQTYTIWFVPEVGRAVKYVRRTFNRARLLLDHEQYELVSYQLK